MGVVYSLLLFAFWSLVFPMGKYLVTYASIFFLVAARMLFGGLLLFLYLVIRKKIPKVTLKTMMMILLFGLLATYLTNAFEYQSLRSLTASNVCFLYSLGPFLTGILSFFHFKERMTPLKVFGLLLGTVSIIFATLHKGDRLWSFTLAEFSMIGAVVCSVYGKIILRVIVKKYTISPFFANSVGMIFGGVVALITSLLLETWNPFPIVHPNWKVFFLILFCLTLISNIICYNVVGFLLKHYTATLISLTGLFSPIFVSFQSYFLLGERPDYKIFIALPFVFVGLLLVYHEEKRLGYYD